MSLNKRGLIPLPGENENSYLERSGRLKNILDAIKPHLSNQAAVDSSALEISSDFILSFYSNRKISFLHGAITLAAPGNEIIKHLRRCRALAHHVSACDEPLSCIQLRTGFKKGSFLKLYSADEVLSHELVHAARYRFDSPRFEEILAFQTSKNRVRRFLGPLFQKPSESYLFMFSLFLFGFTLGTNLYINSALALFFFFLLSRLTWNQLLFHRCKKKLSPLLKDNPLALLIRLTDEEIIHFAHQPQEQILSYIQKQDDFRWSVLYASYFKQI